ncbi:hypothetical protein LZ016_04380 [Sphingomonas sp. SM33]|uniref:Aldehyde-activating protein n=1 Tax=Sphingomonas telluris TaxID=2907998 RepID=A0ABS9VK52_9SPHN|nr:hypothetical protein [Sphingomonas telluris]MCH8615338.1 hypothetical protein [Sphingomonas telluris]
MTDTTSAEPLTLNGSCHCGAVKFTAELSVGLLSALHLLDLPDARRRCRDIQP